MKLVNVEHVAARSATPAVFKTRRLFSLLNMIFGRTAFWTWRGRSIASSTRNRFKLVIIKLDVFLLSDF